MTAPDPGVYISPAQTYQEVQNLAKAIGKLDAKVDAFLREQKDIRQDLGDHETRIRAIEHGKTERQKTEAARIDGVEARTSNNERRIWTASGAVGTVLFGAGYLLQYLLGQ